MTPLRILVDLDSTVTDFFAAWLPYASLLLERHVSVAEVTDYDPSRVWGPEIGRKAFEAMGRPGLYRNMDPLDGAIPGLRRLHDAGHELYVCSAYTVAGSAAEKVEWCAEHLPFIAPGRVFLGREKHMLRVDAVIDDSPAVIRACRDANPGAWIGGIEYPYNRHLADAADLLAPSWRNTSGAWALVVDSLMEFAEARRAA